MIVVDAAVTVWWHQGTPSRIVWQGRRWWVSDVPTRLTVTPSDLPTAITHAPERTAGWRFQVTAEDRETLVVDIVPDDGGWRVARTWS
ncbi:MULTISPECIES: hypothetical protein [unclassified Curtobacterium]|uniref:hypothetical protein n=1 Tax=unclassified Curtobacterium TaxID=257496 RepID=UPI0038024C9E